MLIKAQNVKSAPLFSEKGQRVASAEIDANGTRYVKKAISFSLHALRKPPAIALDTCVLLQALQLGCEYVEVTDRETGTVYNADLETFKRLGFTIQRGHGEQVALVLYAWSTDGVPPPAAPGAGIPKPPPLSMVTGGQSQFSFEYQQEVAA